MLSLVALYWEGLESAVAQHQRLRRGKRQPQAGMKAQRSLHKVHRQASCCHTNGHSHHVPDLVSLQGLVKTVTSLCVLWRNDKQIKLRVYASTQQHSLQLQSRIFHLPCMELSGGDILQCIRLGLADVPLDSLALPCQILLFNPDQACAKSSVCLAMNDAPFTLMMTQDSPSGTASCSSEAVK